MERPPLLTTLYNATRLQRDAFDRSFGQALLASRASYAACLSQLRAVYAPFEARIAQDGWSRRGIDLAARRKVPQLDADLRALGVERPDQIADSTLVPVFDGDATALGWFYALEIIAVRAQSLSRGLQNALNIGPDHGGAFVHGYGDEAGSMWRAFVEAAETLDTGDAARDKIVFGAIAAFNTLLIGNDHVAALTRRDEATQLRGELE